MATEPACTTPPLMIYGSCGDTDQDSSPISMVRLSAAPQSAYKKIEAVSSSVTEKVAVLFSSSVYRRKPDPEPVVAPTEESSDSMSYSVYNEE